MNEVRDLKAARNHVLTIALLLVVAPAQAEIVPWPLTGFAVAKDRASSLECLNNLLQIGFAARVFANNTGHLPSSLENLTNRLDTPQSVLCPANFAHSPPPSWGDLDWNQVDYELVPGADSTNPSSPLCRCKIHNNFINVDGPVPNQGGYRAGWPAVTVHPLDQYATPGSTVGFEAKIVADALQPLSFQWRREHWYFVTNVTFVTDTNAPGGGFYNTNRLSYFTVTPLPGETNTVYTIPTAQTHQNDYYSLAITNAMGVAISQRARLHVDPVAAIMSTNDYWLAVRCQNNLKQIRLLAALWESSHPDRAVTNFDQMMNEDGSPMFGWPVVLYCPADAARTAPTDWSEVNFSDTSYEIVPHPSVEQDPSAAFGRCKVHHFLVAMDQSVSYATNSPVVAGPLANQRTVYGSNAVFRAGALGLPPLTYSWYKEGQPILNATNTTLTLAGIIRADAGLYSVLVSNSAGIARSSATLTVLVPQRLTNLPFQGIVQLMSGYTDGWPVAPGELSGFEAQISSDLLDWTTLPNSLTVSNGLLILRDTSSADQPRRFYRVIQP